MTTHERSKYDAIVIGSGIGGLTAAALLSKLQNKKVLVLEQHFTPGGFTHGFERKGKFHWDVGLHYIGEMSEGSPYRAIFNYLSNGKLKWRKMPDHFDKFVYPDFTFEVNSDPKQFQADLVKQFPHEREGIRRYFGDVQKASFWWIMYSIVEFFPRWLHPILKKAVRHFGAIAKQTTKEYLDQNFRDAHLKSLLTSQWGDYGLPPSLSSFGIHSVVVTHYFEGGWYPVGGGTAIAQTIIPVIEKAGGAVITQRRVTEILLDSGVAKGVKVQHKAHPNAEAEVYHAPIVISDAGAYNTYQKLIPQSFFLSQRKSIEAFPKGAFACTLYLGLKESPEKLGFKGENHWIYDIYDHEVSWKSPTISLKNLPKFCYLTFPSLKNPLTQGHTAEVIASAEYDDFLKWQEKSWKKRGTDYTELKSQMAQVLINFVEKHYPGFQDLIEYVELSTPLTFEHFAASDCGVLYGIPCIPERLDQPWMSARTPIKNLYLTGADAFTPGVTGSMMGGVKAAYLVNGVFGLLKSATTLMLQSSRRG